MKHQLETIPVTDAWKTDSPCPFCYLMHQSEKRHILFYLGNSVMNPETRVQVNAIGFCRHHFPMMRDAGNAHHLGLIGHTHLKHVHKRLRNDLQSLAKGAGRKDVSRLTEAIHALTQDCLICHSMAQDTQRYAYTTLILHRDEPDFRTLFNASTGPCLPHTAELAKIATTALGKRDGRDFLKSLAKRLEQNLDQLEDDVLRFTQKFDAQNKELEWGNARYAHARVVQMLSGRVVRLEE